MKKSTSPMRSDVEKEMKRIIALRDKERALAIWWEQQGQFKTYHHDRLKVYEEALAKYRAMLKDEGQGSEINGS